MRRPTKQQALLAVLIGVLMLVAVILLRASDDAELQKSLDGVNVVPTGAVTNTQEEPQVAALPAPAEPQLGSPPRDIRSTQGQEATNTPSKICEPEFAPSARSGGLLVRLASPAPGFDVIAVMVPYIVDYRPVGFGSGGPPVRTMRTHGVDGVAFIPFLGRDRVMCWVSSQSFGELFENLQLSIPPAAPNEITLDVSPEKRKGVVVGTVRFADGRPAPSYEIRVNPEGSNRWDAPLDIHGPEDLRAAMGRMAVTGPDGSFEVAGLPICEGAMVSVASHGQVLTGTTGVVISDRDRAHQVSLIIPSGSMQTVEVKCRDRRIAGLVLYVSAGGATTSSIRCDRRGEATVFIPDVVQSVTIGFAVMTFTTHREVYAALAAEGFPEGLQIRLFSFLATVAGQTRVVLEQGMKPASPVTLDLTAALARYGDPNDELSPLKGFRRSIEGQSQVGDKIKEAIEAGNVDSIFLRFLEVLGSTAAAIGG